MNGITVINKNSDNSGQMAIPNSLPQRPKILNSLGKETLITLNTFNVAKIPTMTIYQYDVSQLLLL